MILPKNCLFYRFQNDLKEICKPLKKLGIDHFAFTRSYYDGARIYLGTNEVWQENYFQHDYHLIGNCEYHPQIYKSQTLLWSSLPNKHIYEGFKEIGLKEGLFLVRPGKNYTDFIDFVTDKDINIVNVFLSNYEILDLFTQYFQDIAQAILAKEKKNCFILPHADGDLNFLESGTPVLHENPYDIKLSPQQYECAIRLIKGYSYKEIGKELNLSPRTVETYINNLKSKLRIDRRSALISSLSTLIHYKHYNQARLRDFLNDDLKYT